VFNRLWGYDGKVVIFVLSIGFFLVELPTVSLSEWVLARSWHIHHSAMVLRRWDQGIAPLDFTPKEIPV
ncbi:hypothetical protein LINPERPRIM_LOCUS38315, partial [Linum perenne]